MKNRLSIVAAASAALLLAGVAVTPATAQDPIKTRKDGFESMKKAMGQTKSILDKGEAASTVADPAQRMVAFASTIPSLFPAGSDKGDTDALPAIWTNKPDFEAKAKAFEEAAKALEVAAASGDKSAVMKQFAAVGGTCKACHDRYRED